VSLKIILEIDLKKKRKCLEWLTTRFLFVMVHGSLGVGVAVRSSQALHFQQAIFEDPRQLFVVSSTAQPVGHRVVDAEKKRYSFVKYVSVAVLLK
jgi:hypothetical protein